MSVSTAPPPRTKPKISETEIEAMIAKGGTPILMPQDTPESDDDQPAHINARLTKAIVRQIDTLRAKRGRKPGSPKLLVSQQDWVLEACLEKLERDGGGKL